MLKYVATIILAIFSLFIIHSGKIPQVSLLFTRMSWTYEQIKVPWIPWNLQLNPSFGLLNPSLNRLILPGQSRSDTMVRCARAAEFSVPML
jgi:hypothetical protein